MSWKPTGILLVCAAVLFAFIWFVDIPIRQKRLIESNHTVLPGFDPASINSVEIKPFAAFEIAVERTADTNEWRMVRPISYPAEAGPILGLLDALAKLTWQQRISSAELKNQPEAQEKFGFGKAQYEIALQGKNASSRILIGETSALGNQVYVEVVGNPDIYLVDAGLLEFVPSDKDRWRGLALFDLNKMDFQTIVVRSPGRDFELERNLTNNLWFMTNPITARANTMKVYDLLARLQGVRVRQFVSDDRRADLEPYGLQTPSQTPALDLFFWRGTNLTGELQVGSSPTNHPELAYARRQDPSNVVTIDREAIRGWQASYSNFLDYHFISTSPVSIAEISVQGEGKFSVRKLTNDQWEVRADTTFAADAGLMRDWLASFTNIQTQIEKTVATDVGIYGLANPMLRYTLLASGANAVIAQLDFGVNTNGRVFERRLDDAETSVNTISSEDFSRLPRAAWELRDRRIWKFDPATIVSLTIHQEGVTRKYLRDPSGEWTFAPGYHGPPEVNWLSLEEGMHRISDLRAVYWAGAGDSARNGFGFAKMDFKLEIEVKTDGKSQTYSIEFGDRSPYSYPYAAVTQNGQRLVFEFPVDLYENFVDRDMTIPAALRYRPRP